MTNTTLRKQTEQISEGEKKGLTDGPRREDGAQKRLRKAENREKREQKAKARKEIVHCCTMSLCYLGAETDDHYRNPNINTEII